MIVAVDGQELKNALQLSALIGNRRPGEEIAITVNRNGQERTVDVPLEAPEDEAPAVAETRRGDEREGALADELGFQYSDATPEVIERLGLEARVEGALITDINPSSRAYREANLRRGQVIVEMDGEPVRGARDLERIYGRVAAGETFLLKLRQPSGGTYLTALTKPRS